MDCSFVFDIVKSVTSKTWYTKKGPLIVEFFEVMERQIDLDFDIPSFTLDSLNCTSILDRTIMYTWLVWSEIHILNKWSKLFHLSFYLTINFTRVGGGNETRR